MKTRILTSVVGITLLAGVLFFYDTIFFNLIFAALTVIAIHEIYDAFNFGKGKFYIFLGIVPIAILVMLADYVGMVILPVAYMSVLFLAICVIANCNTVNFQKISGVAVFSAIVIFCFYSFIYMKKLLPREVYGYDAMYFVVLILGFAWGGDTMAYFVGRAFGKRKLAPAVSPNKTVEGAIGGVIGSMLLGVIITLIYVKAFGSVLTFTRVHGLYYLIVALIGAVASVLGITGDLFASSVKRQCKIKDYGTIFPGHGGILDRFDSVLFIAPLVAIAATFLFNYFKV